MFYVVRTNSCCIQTAEELAEDFHHKCYICERKEIDRPEIEHRIPRSANKNDKNLLNGWNLFYACSRCNGAGFKGEGFSNSSALCCHGHGYLGIIDCTSCDPNDFIDLDIDVDGNVKISVIEFLEVGGYGRNAQIVQPQQFVQIVGETSSHQRSRPHKPLSRQSLPPIVPLSRGILCTLLWSFSSISFSIFYGGQNGGQTVLLGSILPDFAIFKPSHRNSKKPQSLTQCGFSRWSSQADSNC
ncbi:MAG: hypothetical protein LBJ12_08515 [Oscillospiraceae bacterium]|nr:hypothetical protein [Oscillospiraceae bacterium]